MIPAGLKPQAAPVRPLVVVWNVAPQDLGPTVQSGLDAGCEVMVVTSGGEAVLSGFPEGAGVRVCPLVGKAGKRDAVFTAAAAAGRVGMTHLITLDSESRCIADGLAGIVARAEADPGAVISAVRRFDPSQSGARAHRWRGLTNFWFRLQTGIRLKDAAGGLRAYPLAVLARLTPWSRGESFDYEVLVKAAWAGAVIEEVETAASACRADVPKSFSKRMTERLFFSLLTIHLTLRSVTPWPHRKLVPRKYPPGEVISILHPWRSLKLLVGQNISARRLGLAAALGVFLGTLPLIACHTIAILFTAGFFRLSKVAALGASQLCMPPLVPALCIEAGYFIRHGEFLTEISLRTLGYEALERLVEWFIGSVLLAPVLAIAVGGVVFQMARRIEGRVRSDPPDPVKSEEN